MDPSKLLKEAREALSVRQVYGDPIERDGVTVIPAATVIGGGGGGGNPANEGEGGPNSGFGTGFGGIMWPAGAFEIKDGRVAWRPAIDVTRILLMALTLAIAIVRARNRR